MKIGIGNDAKGYRLKMHLLEALRKMGHEVEDVGCGDPVTPVNYPVYAKAVGEGVAGGKYERGILICGTGIGMSIAANKVAGVRAALVFDVLPAILTREHNDSNVLCLSGWQMTPEKGLEVAVQWLEARYAGGPHQKRLDLISEMEKKG